MFLFARFLHLLVKIHQGQERINDESCGRKEINLCLAALLCDQLLLIRKSFDFTVEWFADFELFASTVGRDWGVGAQEIRGGGEESAGSGSSKKNAKCELFDSTMR